MKIRRSTFILAAALLILAWLTFGCARVPQTGIRFNPDTKQLDITSPKDVEIGRASVYESNGVFIITVEGYTARNNIDVIRAVTEDNAANAERGAKLVGRLIDAAK